MRRILIGVAAAFAAVLLLSVPLAGAATAGGNVLVTGGPYLSADQLAGGTYTDGVLARCGVDFRMQNEPTLAIDPRNTAVWTSGSNDYCTVPTAGDAWAGFYRSSNGGATWTDSLLPGYAGDTSPQGTGSPLHAFVGGGALAAGDPVQSFDGQGNLFYMGNNFNRGTENGASGGTRNNTGSIWVATYAPSNPADTSTDGSKYVRTVILAHNTFGLGSFNDKTELVADPVTGNVYAAWSDFHGAGCNQILFSRSTDHGATFSPPLKISSGICGNQGPSIAIGASGQVYIAWEANTRGRVRQREERHPRCCLHVVVGLRADVREGADRRPLSAVHLRAVLGERRPRMWRRRACLPDRVHLPAIRPRRPVPGGRQRARNSCDGVPGRATERSRADRVLLLHKRRRELELSGAACTEPDGPPVLPVPLGVERPCERDLVRLPRRRGLLAEPAPV